MPVDSASMRVHHAVTGVEVFKKDEISLSDSIFIPIMDDDMYIFVVSWPKTYIKHHVYNNKGFDKNSDDLMEITKPFYYHNKNGNTYVIKVYNYISLENLEGMGSSSLVFENVNCSECDLSDEFWNLYNDFFIRKKKLLDSLKIEYYKNIEILDVKRSKALYAEIDYLKNTFLYDDFLDESIMKKIRENPNSAISTFFLFYQLYNYQEFQKFESTFLSLAKQARETKYYRMILNQY